ncbi:MAG: hypothetical protein ACM34M_05555, partial [Ignavibacteria bacterium]
MKKRFLFFVFIIINSQTLFTQVTIKERVEINPQSSPKISAVENESIVYSDSGISGFIMPRNGKLHIYTSSVERIQKPMPSYSTLAVHFFKGDSMKIYSLNSVYNSFKINRWNRYDYCIQAYRTVEAYTYSNAYFNPAVLGFTASGDTFQFSYHSDLIGSGKEYTFGVYDAYEVHNMENMLVGWYIFLGEIDSCQHTSNILSLDVFIDDVFELKLQPEPEIISAGDTARIVIKKEFSTGKIEDFPADQTFEAAILEGCLSGNLLVGDSLGSYFYDKRQPIYFVADSSADSGIVKIRIGLMENIDNQYYIHIPANSSKNLINKNIQREREQIQKIAFHEGESKNMTISANVQSCLSGEVKSKKSADCEMNIKKQEEEQTILLGETKYFGVKKKVEGGKIKEIKIEEIKVNVGEEPIYPSTAGEGWEWVKEDVWGDKPVEKAEGDKLGVYWEKEKPVWNGSEKGKNLIKGLIRIIGKYWEEEKIYKVKLAANYSLIRASIQLIVKKPIKISSVYNISKYKKNVFSESFNLDSLIIKYAGKYGILPQIIKAQMMWESSFKPAYRYEPFPDVTGIQTDYRYINNRYKIINTSNQGNPSIPENHSYVSPQFYWGNQNTIWEFFYAHSSTLNPDISFDSDLNIYPMKNAKGDYIWFEWPAKKWKEIFDKKYKEKIKEKVSADIAMDSA